MEKIKFLSFYKRELERINRFNVQASPEEQQRLEYTIQNKYSENERLIHTIDSIESTYHNCAADNLDFADQITMNEFIPKLRQTIVDYIHSNNKNISLDIIEQVIVLANLYLGMQVFHYPAFIKLANTQYIDKELLSQSNETDFEIPDFQTTLNTLQKLQLTKYEVVSEKQNFIRFYEKELNRLHKYQRLEENTYKKYNETSNEEERLDKLVSNIKAIKTIAFTKIMELGYEYFQKEALASYIHDLESAIYNYTDYDISILEMMLEITNLLLNIKAKNLQAFSKLIDINYVENYILPSTRLQILSFEDTYNIIKGFNKTLK